MEYKCCAACPENGEAGIEELHPCGNSDCVILQDEACKTVLKLYKKYYIMAAFALRNKLINFDQLNDEITFVREDLQSEVDGMSNETLEEKCLQICLRELNED